MDERISKEGVEFFKSIIGIEFKEDSEYVQNFVNKYKNNMEELIYIMESEKKTEIRELTEKLDEIRKISNEKVPLFDKLTKEVKELELKKKTLIEDVTSIKSEISEINKEIQEIGQMKDTLIKGINDLEIEKSNMLEDNKLALEEVNKTKSELKELKENCCKSQEELNVNVYLLQETENKLRKYKLLSKILNLPKIEDYNSSNQITGEVKE